MTGPELLRADTILARFAHAGARVVAITAKEKLRQQLGKDLDLSRGSVCFSSVQIRNRYGRDLFWMGIIG
jgi:phosphonoacetate hydrolase